VKAVHLHQVGVVEPHISGKYLTCAVQTINILCQDKKCYKKPT